jgi:hypothetical protein
MAGERTPLEFVCGPDIDAEDELATHDASVNLITRVSIHILLVVLGTILGRAKRPDLDARWCRAGYFTSDLGGVRRRRPGSDGEVVDICEGCAGWDGICQHQSFSMHDIYRQGWRTENM